MSRNGLLSRRRSVFLPDTVDARNEQLLNEAAGEIRQADALFIGAGAGMGVDSGLPDFRGPQGFWRAYPVLEKRGIHFEEMANPEWFEQDPALAWAFYGHRLNLYRATNPHIGFEILREFAAGKAHGAFVFTSNVDGQFDKAGFPADRVAECHGSIHHLQCTAMCRPGIWPAEGVEVVVDETAFRAKDPLPRCPECGALARPNILMFGDFQWLHGRTNEQEDAMEQWLSGLLQNKVRLAVIELGAGTAIPSVRHTCERVARQHHAKLIRINPREPDVPEGHIGLALGAANALEAIARVR